MREACALGAAGVVFALAANQISPRGLSLARDYFPPAPPAPPASAAPAAAPLPASAAPVLAAAPGTNAPALHTNGASLAARLAGRGLGMVESNAVYELFMDPRRQAEGVVFVDARSEADYQAGHIPGARVFDHYYPQNTLAGVLAACQAAEAVVVYCAGGNCEDSEFAAVMLQEAGVAGARLLVYGGGFGEWSAQGRPVETGARDSGVLRAQPPSSHE